MIWERRAVSQHLIQKKFTILFWMSGFCLVNDMQFWIAWNLNLFERAQQKLQIERLGKTACLLNSSRIACCFRRTHVAPRSMKQRESMCVLYVQNKTSRYFQKEFVITNILLSIAISIANRVLHHYQSQPTNNTRKQQPYNDEVFDQVSKGESGTRDVGKIRGLLFQSRRQHCHHGLFDLLQCCHGHLGRLGIHRESETNRGQRLTKDYPSHGPGQRSIGDLEFCPFVVVGLQVFLDPATNVTHCAGISH